jgi:hypothetical protein
VLDDTAWDDVLVTLARSLDGSSLDLALEPAGERTTAVRLAFVALEPGSSYRLTASDGSEIGSVVADPDGRASISIAVLDRPLRLRLEVSS